MVPSIGRIVHVHGVYANRADPAPAVITRVREDGLLNLTALPDGEEPRYLTKVAQGREAGQWDWPEKVAE